MQFKLAALSILSSALAVAAQDVVVLVGSTPDAPGGGFFQYIPPTINATNGTTITFKFTGTPGNHTITQSSFANPCSPLAGGFDSGYVYIPPSNVSHTPEWNLTVTDDSQPIWFFCKQLLPTPHCPAGMVGAINPPTSGNTFEAFRNAARNFRGTISQAEGGLVGSGASASVLPGPITEGASFYTAPAATNTAPGASAASSTPSSKSGGSYPSGALSLGVNSFLLTVCGALLGGALVLA